MNLELTLLALVLGSLAVTAVCRRLGVSAPLVLVRRRAGGVAAPGRHRGDVRPGGRAAAGADAAAVLGRARLVLPRDPGQQAADRAARRRPGGVHHRRRRARRLVADPGPAAGRGAGAGRGGRAAGRRVRAGRRPPAGPAAPGDDDPRRREPDQRRDGADPVPGVRRGRGRHRGDGAGRAPACSCSPPSAAPPSGWPSAGWCTGSGGGSTTRRSRARWGWSSRSACTCSPRACTPPGVLAVVVAGLYLGYRSPESGYATRLQDGVCGGRATRSWSRWSSR